MRSIIMGSICVADDVLAEVSAMATASKMKKKELVEEILRRNLGVLAKERLRQQIAIFLSNFEVEDEVRNELSGLLNILIMRQGQLTGEKVAMLKNALLLLGAPNE